MLSWLLGKSSPVDLKKMGSQPTKAEDIRPTSGPSNDRGTLLVVNKPTSRPRLDSSELQTIADLPDFHPLLRNSQSPGENDALPTIDARNVLGLVKRYENHMRQCAEAVSFDQNALCVRVKEIDFAIKVLADRMSERQKLLARHAEQMQKAQDLSRSLNKLSMSLRQTMALIESLNEKLPTEDRLENLEFGTHTARAADPLPAPGSDVSRPQQPALLH